jgi:hypothetical protein
VLRIAAALPLNAMMALLNIKWDYPRRNAFLKEPPFSRDRSPNDFVVRQKIGMPSPRALG